MSEPKKVRLPEFFFDTKTGGYWLRLEKERRFIPLDGSQLGLHLQLHGLDKEARRNDGLSLIQYEQVIAQQDRNVAYAGALAGHPVGVFTSASGQRVLVTSEPRGIFGQPEFKPKRKGPADFPRLFAVLSDLFGEDQIGHVFCVLKLARESLIRQDFRPGQMVVLAGPSSAGKTFFSEIYREVLGGRIGKPYRYMVGLTTFNADICAAELLVIDDDNASTTPMARRAFGQSIKQFTVVKDTSLHGKNKEAIVLATYKRLLLLCNDEPENLLILPILDDSILDKLMLFKVRTMQVSKDESNDRSLLWKPILAEMPAFLAFLHHFKVPAELKCPRFGVTAFHHPDLIEALGALSPEQRLLSMIDAVLWKDDDAPEIITAMELEGQLRTSQFAFAADGLFRQWQGACGAYLARLAKQFPERIEKRKTENCNKWIIKAPTQREFPKSK